ncbi:hypothetical protein ACFX1R_007906 [Malus domestica]
MASKTSSFRFFSLIIFSFAIIQMAIAGDPNIITDFIVPSNANGIVDGNFFTYTGFHALVEGDPSTAFKAMKASLAKFPTLNGQSVRMPPFSFQMALPTHHTLIFALPSYFSSMVVPLKLVSLTPKTTSLRRRFRHVICLCFPRDLRTSSTMLMQKTQP